MNKTFDEAYARYRSFLVKLDKTEDVAEKNLLFRQLTAQLSELESRLSSKQIFNASEAAHSEHEDAELTYWI